MSAVGNQDIQAQAAKITFSIQDDEIPSTPGGGFANFGRNGQDGGDLVRCRGADFGRGGLDGHRDYMYGQTDGRGGRGGGDGRGPPPSPPPSRRSPHDFAFGPSSPNAKDRCGKGGVIGGSMFGDGIPVQQDAPPQHDIPPAGGFVSGYANLGPNDVLCGRGKKVQANPGNVAYRALIACRKSEYNAAKAKQDKQLVAKEIVHHVLRCTNPPGRFLAMIDETVKKTMGLPVKVDSWYPVDDQIALEKTKRTLRQRQQKSNSNSVNDENLGRTVLLEVPDKGGGHEEAGSIEEAPAMPAANINGIYRELNSTENSVPLAPPHKVRHTRSQTEDTDSTIFAPRGVIDDTGVRDNLLIRRVDLGPNDVLCGRGWHGNAGNQAFLEIVTSRKSEYTTARTDKEKNKIAREVVDHVRHRVNPPGRFLRLATEQEVAKIKKGVPKNMWCLVGNDAVIERARQALRQQRKGKRNKLERLAVKDTELCNKEEQESEAAAFAIDSNTQRKVATDATLAKPFTECNGERQESNVHIFDHQVNSPPRRVDYTFDWDDTQFNAHVFDSHGVSVANMDGDADGLAKRRRVNVSSRVPGKSRREESHVEPLGATDVTTRRNDPPPHSRRLPSVLAYPCSHTSFLV